MSISQHLVLGGHSVEYRTNSRKLTSARDVYEEFTIDNDFNETSPLLEQEPLIPQDSDYRHSNYDLSCGRFVGAAGATELTSQPYDGKRSSSSGCILV